MPDKSEVFFSDLRSGAKRNLFDKLDTLLESVGPGERFRKGHLVAVKLRFGEKGNASSRGYHISKTRRITSEPASARWQYNLDNQRLRCYKI